MGEIVVGVDGSPGATAALQWAASEAQLRSWTVSAVIACGYLERHYRATLLGDDLEPRCGDRDARATLDAARRSPSASRRRLIELQQTALVEVASAVSGVLVDEMVGLHIAPLEDGASLGEIRVAQAQLVGWMDGLLRTRGVVDGRRLAPDQQPLPAAPSRPPRPRCEP